MFVKDYTSFYRIVSTNGLSTVGIISYYGKKEDCSTWKICCVSSFINEASEALASLFCVVNNYEALGVLKDVDGGDIINSLLF